MSETDKKAGWKGRKGLIIFVVIFGLLAVVISIAGTKDIKIDNTDISELSKETLSRKEQNIYNEIINSWDKTTNEVNQKFPLKINKRYPPEYLRKRQAYNEELKEKYYNEIAVKYGLTVDQLDTILKKGSLL